jgi:hypothetical protein
MRSSLSLSDRFKHAMIGAAAGALVGIVLAVVAAYTLDSFPLRRTTIVVRALVVATLGFARGSETGDLFGMFLHGGVQSAALDVTGSIYTPRAPKGTYRPRYVAIILIGLVLLAFALAWR